MRIGNLTAGAGALRQALKMLRMRWEDTKSQWDDRVSQEFEENHLVELDRECQKAIEHIGHLAHVLTKCYQECSE